MKFIILMPFIVPIVAAIAEAVAAVGTFVAAAGVIGQGLIMAGIGVAASYLISALTPKPQTDGSNQPGGVNFERDYGSDVSRQVACGLVGLAGHDTYVNTYASSNSEIQQVYVFSDFPCTALSRVWAGGIQLVLGDDTGDPRGRPVTGPTGTVTVPFIDEVWIKFHDGTQTSADAGLVANANPSDRWSSADIGTGIAHVVVTMSYDQNNNNSFPDFFFEVQGAPLYDWRKDSTNGGSGSHRWGTISTYEYSANPIVIEYNYRRGFAFAGDQFCGMFMDTTDLPVDKFTTAANICDELQDDSLPRYVCSILLDCMTTHSDNLQSLANSCGAMQIDDISGSWPLVGTDQSIAFTFTDADLISTAQNFKRTEKQSMSTLVNSVSGNYPEPDQLWSMVGYDPQIASDFLVIDRRTRDLSMDFPQVPSQRQADQLAWIYLYENRFEAVATVTLRPRFQVAEAGDWCTWNSARYGSKTFIVTGKSLLNLDNGDGPRNVILSLQERDGQIYDGITPSTPVLPFPAGDPVYMSEVADFALVAVSVTGSGGIVQAAIRVSWDVPTDLTITQVDVEYFPTADPTSIIHKIVTVDQTVVVVAEGVVSDTDYTVRAKIISNPQRTTTFNVGASVHTLTVGGAVTLADFDAALTYQVTTLLSNLNDRIAAIEQQTAAVASNQNGREWNNKQMVQTQLRSVTGNLTASITQVMTVATDATTALASLDTIVTAQGVSIDENITAISDINGLSVASWSMTLDVNGYISGIKLLSDGTTSAFVIASNDFQIANPSVFGGAAQTVFTLQTVLGVTSMALSGNFVADGSITAQAINVASLSSISANIGTITAGEMISPSGFTDFDLTNERLIFSDNS